MIEIEVWTKESKKADQYQDLYLGGCSLTNDQLKVGNGVREYFSLLKDNVKVGHVLIKSTFTPDLEEDYFDILVNTQKLEDELDVGVIQTPTIDHQLDTLNQARLGNASAISTFADPLADWKASMSQKFES